jgi:hypothetical protein
MSDDVRFD